MLKATASATATTTHTCGRESASRDSRGFVSGGVVVVVANALIVPTDRFVSIVTRDRLRSRRDEACYVEPRSGHRSYSAWSEGRPSPSVRAYGRSVWVGRGSGARSAAPRELSEG